MNNKLCFIFIVGFLWIFLIPPFQSPDEGAHFYRLQSIKNGSVFSQKNEHGYYNEAQSSLREYISSHDYMLGKSTEKYSYNKWYIDSHAELSEGATEKVFSSAANYNPIFYLPQLAALYVGEVIYLGGSKYNWQSQLYFSRFGSFIFSLFFVALSARALKENFNFLAPIIFIPMFFFMGSMVSPDVVLNGACLLFICIIIRACRAGEVNALDFFLISFCALIMSATKIVYSPLLCFGFILCGKVPNKEFMMLAAATLSSAVLGLASTVVLFPPAINDDKLSQLNFLADNMLSSIDIIVNSIDRFDVYYINSMIMNFGSLDTNIPYSFVVLFCFCLIAIPCFFVDFGFKLKLSQFFLFSAAVIGSAFLIFMATYVEWTSRSVGIGADHVDGVQGRYFIPLLPYAMFLISCMCPIKIKQTIHASYMIFSFLCGVSALSVFCVVMRYWV